MNVTAVAEGIQISELELDDLLGPFQPKPFDDSMICSSGPLQRERSVVWM